MVTRVETSIILASSLTIWKLISSTDSICKLKEIDTSSKICLRVSEAVIIMEDQGEQHLEVVAIELISLLTYSLSEARASAALPLQTIVTITMLYNTEVFVKS